MWALSAPMTTLMRAALGLTPFTGESSLVALPHVERARQVAWMPQSREIAWPVSVEDVVMLGRMPHMSARPPSETDEMRVADALEWMDISDMRQRPATGLSGGERARVLIARMLAQDTPLVMADEPVAGLDPAHQISTMQTFGKLARAGKSVLVSLHDLSLAARHCTRLIMLAEGRLLADGAAADVLTPERLANVFHITAWYRRTEHGPIYQPLEVIQ